MYNKKIKDGKICVCKKIVGVYHVLGIDFHQEIKLNSKFKRNDSVISNAK